MKKWPREIWRLCLIIFLGFIGSMIAGLLNYGGNIFDTQSAGFAYYIVFGFSTSLIFAFYHMWGLTPSIVGSLGISTASFIIIGLFVPF
jgi:CHASE2 domain-containing sensor protein